MAPAEAILECFAMSRQRRKVWTTAVSVDVWGRSLGQRTPVKFYILAALYAAVLQSTSTISQMMLVVFGWCIVAGIGAGKISYNQRSGLDILASGNPWFHQKYLPDMKKPTEQDCLIDGSCSRPPSPSRLAIW